MSNSLDPDQADILSGLIWVQTVCKSYQQTTLKNKACKSYSRLDSNLRPLFGFSDTSYSTNCDKNTWLHICRGELFCLLITFLHSSLDPDQAQQNVGPDLYPNCLTSLFAFHKDFSKISILKKKSAENKDMQIVPACKELGLTEYNVKLVRRSTYIVYAP